MRVATDETQVHDGRLEKKKKKKRNGKLTEMVCAVLYECATQDKPHKHSEKRGGKKKKRKEKKENSRRVLKSVFYHCFLFSFFPFRRVQKRNRNKKNNHKQHHASRDVKFGY
eukprot:TRINITY_DN5483_c0_g1_i1.p1 TRINITY_DN5483_c0_g1~~TRINITY_DN5483_c0_g1_i1.p1  ORF type:complete len:112 (-),score=16.27 TRINITY_DN5483_c0_g1_i1:76-411(-)